MKNKRVITLAIIGICGVVGAGAFFLFRVPPDLSRFPASVTEFPPLDQELIEPGEKEKFEGFAQVVTQIQDKNRVNGEATRGFHGKAHGCLLGKLIPNKDRDPRTRFGIFADGAPESYSAWVRYSNGVGPIKRDDIPDVRGMAIKVLNIPGKKLMSGEEDARTQDFIMTNNPTPLGDTAAEFVEFGQAISSTLQFKLPGFLASHPKVNQLFVNRILKRHILSMLTESFWSGSPYRLGTHASKFLVKPCTPEGESPISTQDPKFGFAGWDFDAKTCHAVPATVLTTAPDFLRDNIVEASKNCNICYDFYVQFQSDPVKTPIEHHLTEWKESDAPAIPVAKLILPKQIFTDENGKTDQKNFCENLSFNPWHALPDHQPLGNVNRARRIAYDRSRANRTHLGDRASSNPANDRPADESKVFVVPAGHRFL